MITTWSIKKAIEYYNKGDYQRAMNLLDGVRSVFVGQAKAQNIAYYRAFVVII